MPSYDVNLNGAPSTGQPYVVPVVEGDVLAGKYEVEQILGQGGMGLVVSAMHLQLRERVALKFLLPAAAQHADFNARFLREAQVTAKLRNEHIVRVTDVGVLETGAPYMVMEYLQGYDLRQALKDTGTLPLADAVDFVLQACEGVAEAHALGIVHRDLKPSNIFVTQRRDGSALVKVLDFGISKANLLQDGVDGELTQEGMLLGSPRYMSPEQLTSSSGVDSRSDVWSLATILFELLSGKAPFAGESQAATCARIFGTDPPPALRELRPEVPEALEQAILHGLERDKDKRSRDVSVFAEEVVAAVTNVVPAAVLRVSVDRMRAMLEGAMANIESSQKLRITQTGPVVASKVSAASAASVAGSETLTVRGVPSSTSRGWTASQNTGWGRGKVVGTLLAGVAAVVLVVSGWLVFRGKPVDAVVANPEGSAVAPGVEPVVSASAVSAVQPVPSASIALSASAEPAASAAVPDAKGAKTRPKWTGKKPADGPTQAGTSKPTKPVDPMADRQ